MPSKTTIRKVYYGSKTSRPMRRVKGRTYSKVLVQRQFRQRNQGNNGRYKLKGIFNMTTSGTGSLLATFRITRPDLFDGTASSVTDWAGFAALYDQYRVMSVKIKWIPSIPNNESNITTFKPLYVFTDFDSVSLVPTNAVAVGYENMRVFNLYRPWSYFVRIPKLVAPAATNVSMLGYFDTLTTVDTGGIYLSQVSGLTASTEYGTVIITYYVKGQMRR